jgi:hypothetical protein
MPTWGQILNEVNSLVQIGDQVAFDKVRNKYVAELSTFTHRNTIVYATKWTSGDAPPNLVSINDEDIQALMEAVHGLKGDNLDLILHSPGGSAESADAIVSYLRQKFKNIRVIIPQAAMSAGTMIACAADLIVMAKHSSIGPIDPQFILQTSIGIQAVPAYAILEQFEKAQKELIDDPKKLSSWLPMLNQYGPALLIQCRNQIEFGKQLVRDWLKAYMHSGNPEVADRIADYLSNHSNFKTHAKHLSIEKAREIGLKIQELESDQEFQEKVLSAFHAAVITFNTSVVKVVYNQHGNTYLKQHMQVNLPMPHPDQQGILQGVR